MTWTEALIETARNKPLVEQYDRLHGTNLSRRGAPIDLMIDQATGRFDLEIQGFIEFFDDCVWQRVELSHVQRL